MSMFVLMILGGGLFLIIAAVVAAVVLTSMDTGAVVAKLTRVCEPNTDLEPGWMILACMKDGLLDENGACAYSEAEGFEMQKIEETYEAIEDIDEQFEYCVSTRCPSTYGVFQCCCKNSSMCSEDCNLSQADYCMKACTRARDKMS